MSIKSVNDFALEWRVMNPRPLGNSFSHTRIVYIGKEESLAAKWVVKIATPEIRRAKLALDISHAEEVAYKVCKLLRWDIVPKSKVIHEKEMNDLGSKINKYKPFMQSFSWIAGIKTFTFQHACTGKPLFTDRNTPIPKRCAFQKAYLLGMLLGGYDSRRDNMLYDPQIGKLALVDNEYLGQQNYDTIGILRIPLFEKFRKENLDPLILEAICKADAEKLAQICEKYRAKGVNLLALWYEEPNLLDEESD